MSEFRQLYPSRPSEAPTDDPHGWCRAFRNAAAAAPGVTGRGQSASTPNHGWDAIIAREAPQRFVTQAKRSGRDG